MSWVQTVLAEARRQGLSLPVLLAAAGIRPDELDAARWPIDHITRLWRAAARLTQDPGFGLKAGSQVGPASFNVVSFILQSAATLRQALGVVQKYQTLVSDGGRFQLLPGAQASWLVYHPRQGELAFSPHQLEAVLAAVVTSTRWIHPRPLQPERVRFSHEQVGPLAGYREAFGCPVEFNQAYSGLLISNDALDLPLPQANPQLAQVHEALAAAQLEALAATQSAAQAPDLALQAWIARHLGPPLPTRAAAALAFGWTERTLARRLQRQGTTWGALLDDARRAQALQRVGGTTQPLKDIALGLGFAELSPFYRAFARWTGATPGQWRAQGQAGEREA